MKATSLKREDLVIFESNGQESSISSYIFILGDNPRFARNEIIIFGIYKIKRYKVCYVDIGLIVCRILLYFTLLKYKNHSKVLFILVWRIHKSAGG